jgi:hypothetical protein
MLLRNPDYRGGRPRGFARIQIAEGNLSVARRVADIEAGTADYTSLYDSLPPARHLPNGSPLVAGPEATTLIAVQEPWSSRRDDRARAVACVARRASGHGRVGGR